MRLVRLLAVAMTPLAMGVIASAAAAEEEKANLGILCLVTACGALGGTFKGGASLVDGLTGNAIHLTNVELTFNKLCEETAGGKDVTSCKDQRVALTGAEVSGVKCKSEGDEIGTILFLVDIRTSVEKSGAGVLEPLFLMKLLSLELKPEELFSCGVLKLAMKGTFGCLAIPGLANIPTTENVEISCKLTKSNDPETGKCESGCEELEKDPFLVNFGKGFEDSWIEVTLLGKFTKDVFIDD